MKYFFETTLKLSWFIKSFDWLLNFILTFNFLYYVKKQSKIALEWIIVANIRYSNCNIIIKPLNL